MRHCCLSSGRNTPFTTPFLIHLETVARSTFKSFATSEAFKKAFIQLQYKLGNTLSRGQTVACVASINSIAEFRMYCQVKFSRLFSNKRPMV